MQRPEGRQAGQGVAVAIAKEPGIGVRQRPVTQRQAVEAPVPLRRPEAGHDGAGVSSHVNDGRVEACVHGPQVAVQADVLDDDPGAEGFPQAPPAAQREAAAGPAVGGRREASPRTPHPGRDRARRPARHLLSRRRRPASNAAAAPRGTAARTPSSPRGSSAKHSCNHVVPLRQKPLTTRTGRDRPRSARPRSTASAPAMVNRTHGAGRLFPSIVSSVSRTGPLPRRGIENAAPPAFTGSFSDRRWPRADPATLALASCRPRS